MTPYTKERVQKTHRLCSLRLKRVSLVGSPANEAAKVVLFKSADPTAQHGVCRNSACRSRIAAGVRVPIVREGDGTAYRHLLQFMRRPIGRPRRGG